MSPTTVSFPQWPATRVKAWVGPKKASQVRDGFPDRDLGDAQPLRSTKPRTGANSGTASSPPLGRPSTALAPSKRFQSAGTSSPPQFRGKALFSSSQLDDGLYLRDAASVGKDQVLARRAPRCNPPTSQRYLAGDHHWRGLLCQATVIRNKMSVGMDGGAESVPPPEAASALHGMPV